MKLLIVDDDKDLCELYTTLFSMYGYEVRVSHDGLRAITGAVDFKPDIILLDIMMPEMNGYEFLDSLRNNTSLNPVVIILSNINKQLGIDKALAHGADAYLPKSDYSGKGLVDAVQMAYQTAIVKRSASDQRK